MGKIVKIKKLVIVVDSPGFGGSEINLIKLINFLKDEYEISFITSLSPSKELISFIEENKFEINKYYFSNKFSSIFCSLFKAFIVLNRTTADFYIFWCHHINSSRWLQIASAFLKKKIIVVEQLLPTHYLSPIVSKSAIICKKYVASKAHKIIICGYSQEKNYQLNFKTKNTFVIPNTRNVLQIYEEVKIIRKKQKDETHFVICCVGRLTEQKNQETLVRAFSKLETEKKIKLILVGDGENREKIEELLLKNQIKNIEITGFIQNVNYYLAISDLFILPSLDEGLPGAVLEAMASKTACVVSDIPGNNELIINKDTGYTFHPKDDKELKKIIEYLIKAPEERKRVFENAYNKVLKEYDQKVEFEKWKKLINNII